MLGIPLTDEKGETVDQGLALIPRSDLEYEETWFVAGMKSTGSNGMIAKDVFVLDHRIVSVPAVIEGNYGTEHTGEVFYRSAFVPILALVLAGPQLGMGRAVLQIVKGEGGQEADLLHLLHRPGRLRCLPAAAGRGRDADRYRAPAHAYRAADDIDQAAARGVYPDYLTRALVRADTGWAIDHIVKAIGVLLSAHGAASFAEASPLQRIWRDSSVAARHAVVLPVVGDQVYGKALLGREDHITPLV